MAREYTNYLSGPLGDDGEAFQKAWEKLRFDLRSALRRSGLWNMPSLVVGPTQARTFADRTAFDEAIQLCFCYILGNAEWFAERAGEGEDVEAAVRKGIHWFLLAQKHEVKRTRDDSAEAVSKMVVNIKEAVKKAIKAGIFERVPDGSRGIRNRTLLIAAGADPPAEPAGAATLREAVLGLEQWGGVLERWRLPRPADARPDEWAPWFAREDSRFQELLAEGLSTFPAFGIRSFHFGDLVAAIEGELRGVAAAYRANQLGKPSFPTEEDAVALPDSLSVDQDEFDRFREMVLEGIGRRRPVARQRMRQVFEEVVEHARLNPAGPRLRLADIAERLGIGTNRVEEVWRRLSEIFEEVRRANSDNPPRAPLSSL